MEQARERRLAEGADRRLRNRPVDALDIVRPRGEHGQGCPCHFLLPANLRESEPFLIFFTLIAKNQERRFRKKPTPVSPGAVAAGVFQRSAFRKKAAAPLREDSRENKISNFFGEIDNLLTRQRAT